jgi:succinoglycan biosynthesis protein ExoM
LMDKQGSMNNGSPHITVCICTVNRPEMLRKLLNKLDTLRTDSLFTYSLVVIDNDVEESAKSIVESYSQSARIPVRYDVEPERGFALVRNRAVANAQGDFIAFIDDDEVPNNTWLINLFKISEKFGADGVLGPVKPLFAVEPPEWVLKGKFCERQSFETGTVLNSDKYMRTGNVLLRMSIFDKVSQPFDVRYGKTGGEDSDYFRRMLDIGKIFVWCDEAIVYELFPAERMERIYFLRRALLRGYIESKRSSFASIDTAKSIIAVMVYTMALPFLLPFGQHVIMKYMIRNCDHVGKLIGFCGIILFKERPF